MAATSDCESELPCTSRLASTTSSMLVPHEAIVRRLLQLAPHVT